VTANTYWHLEEILKYASLYPVSEILSVLNQCIEIGTYHKNSVKRLLGEREIGNPCLESFGVLPASSSVDIERPLCEYRMEVAHA
jgi:hypothetical protein